MSSETAMPTSAAASAPASFRPSPTISTRRPAACRARTAASLSSGDCRNRMRSPNTPRQRGGLAGVVAREQPRLVRRREVGRDGPHARRARAWPASASRRGHRHTPTVRSAPAQGPLSERGPSTRRACHPRHERRRADRHARAVDDAADALADDLADVAAPCPVAGARARPAPGSPDGPIRRPAGARAPSRPRRARAGRTTAVGLGGRQRAGLVEGHRVDATEVERDGPLLQVHAGAPERARAPCRA